MEPSCPDPTLVYLSVKAVSSVVFPLRNHYMKVHSLISALSCSQIHRYPDMHIHISKVDGSMNMHGRPTCG